MSDVIAKEVQDLEMAPQEAFVTLYEVEVIEDTDYTGQSRTLYFHAENTEEDIKFNNGEAGSQPKIYSAFPMIMQGVETRGDGASNRPTITIPNVESLFRSGSALDRESYPWDAENAYMTGDVVTYDGKQYVRLLSGTTTPTVNSTLPSANQTATGNGVWILATGTDLDGKNELLLEDLIGKRVTRRQTLSKYVQVGSATAPSSHYQFPKSIYVIDRISARTSISITFELASPFDLANVKLPNRIVTSQYCPWVYKGWRESNTDVKSACYWKGTVRDSFTETGGTVQLAESPIMYFYTIDDEPLILHDLGSYSSANTTQNGTISSLLFTLAHPTGGRTYGINAIAYVPGTGVPDMFFQSLQNANTQAPSESNNQWRVVRTYTIWHQNETYNPYIPDSRRSDYVYDKGIVYKCLKTNTNKVPGDNPSFWAQADVCGKLLSSCKARYQVKGTKRFTLSDGNKGPDDAYNHRPNIPLSRNDRGSLSGSAVQVSSYNGTARFHGLPKYEFDNSISLPFGAFPGTRRLR